MSTRGRQASPELTKIADPGGVYRSFVDFIEQSITRMGTAEAVARFIGLTNGSRISDWRQGVGGRPSISSALALSKINNDNPLHIMIMCGYKEEAAILQDYFSDRSGEHAPPGVVERPKQQMRKSLELLKEALREIERA